MTDWVNNGSCKDLSSLAKDSMWPTSQAGGNMQSSSKGAMTAPGSVPVDPLPDRKEQGDPMVDVPDAIPVGTDGKPKTTAGSMPTATGPRWSRTAVTDGVRKD